MRRFAVQIFVIGLILTSQAFAAPLEVKQVAADAKWLAHVDVDAIRASTVVQKAWQRVLEKCPDIETKLALGRALVGIDPTKDIHGITFYGTVIGKPEAVTIASVSLDPQRIIGLASVIPGRETHKHRDYVVHCWVHKHHRHTITVAATFRGQDQLVLANSVLDKKAAGLSKDDKLGGKIPAGTTFLLRVEGIAEATLHCKIPVLRQMESFRMVMGEDEGQSFVRIRVTMSNPEIANLVQTATQGWQAQFNLLCPDEIARKFVNAVHSKVDGQNVTILWSASANDVWDGLVKIEQEIKKHIARHHAHSKHAKTDKDGDKAAEKKETPTKKTVPPEEDF